MDSKAFEQLTIGTSASGFTTATVRPANSFPMLQALVTVNAGQIRVRFDGTAPTASVGHLFTAGNSFTVTYPDLINTSMISANSTNAQVAVTYQRGA
uniref:Uncharacterized protein n=1 Tax=viral metagenome TaxID=1070528 RepID=A0A6H1ZTA8_9ZZZZ